MIKQGSYFLIFCKFFSLQTPEHMSWTEPSLSFSKAWIVTAQPGLNALYILPVVIKPVFLNQRFRPAIPLLEIPAARGSKPKLGW